MTSFTTEGTEEEIVSEPRAIARGSRSQHRIRDPVASTTPRELLAQGPRSAPGSVAVLVDSSASRL